ncbi:MAG: ArsR family transcriptional regulator [Chloroflexota bacterium]|nr:ArsR family transcriptional regulator [Chloroflexota bacterium]
MAAVWNGRDNGRAAAQDAQDAPTTLRNVHNNMLDGLGQLSDYFGFSKVMGQLYGALLLSQRPLCLDDLVETLDISKANASMNIRTLENMGMVRQVWVRGSSGRRKFYEAETDFGQIISNILKGREMRDVDRALLILGEDITRLNTAMAQMDEAQREMASLYVHRIAQMQGLFQLAQLLITAILMRVGDGLDFAQLLMDIAETAKEDAPPPSSAPKTA